ncbi:RNA polymerase sigma-70 factor [Panacibacter ginsenosidivorans]|uniref:RNA polymerase sigma-70 factor n=1 Tax=Panacibacter ginsenosidivorans TaxID=1813871 RepID=A0A5B8V8P2_9BACT|nr:RNA polymerase sigma-70 factor [Panacibacter ginsenosidivorans]QEC67910.1 RNA polymerase sigma-70 factor [Panacibacter ginsenosidivorans]
MINDLLNIQQGIANGNELMLGELYKLFHKKLQHFSRAITRSDEIAEEVVDDVFVKLWNRRGKVAEIENITVYLYIAIKNQSLNALSRKAQQLVSESFDYLDIEIEEAIGDPEVLMITEEMMHRMQKAVEDLPPRCKMVFKLVREDGLKYKEVSQILNISVNTIDVQMAIAIKRICTALQLEKPKRNFTSTATEKKV